MAASNRLMGPAKAPKQRFQWVHLLLKNLLEKLLSESNFKIYRCSYVIYYIYHFKRMIAQLFWLNNMNLGSRLLFR